MKIENLIAGLGQRILSAGDLESDAGQMNTPAASGKLTDGVFAQKATYTDPAYHKFYGSIDRTIVYDLGDVCAVSGFMGSFLHEEQTAVRLPAYVRIALSEDGDGWETVAEIKPERTNVESEIRKLSAEFEPRAARYVGISFNVACWVFVDQFEVYGVRDAAGAKSIVPEKKTAVNNPNRYVEPDDFYGIHDIMLAYNCLYSNPERGLLTKELLLPYVAYYDRDGKMKDIYFDSFLFLPFVAAAPSGGYYYDNKSKPGCLDDWKYYVNDTFTPGKNVEALNDAVGEVKQILGLENYRARVFFSILFPTETQKEFGVVDGKKLDFTRLDDRKAAVRWLVNEQLNRFKAGGFDNLLLTGFYWFHEAVDYSDPNELELLRYTTDYVRSLGYSTIWIPWYQASGFHEWQKFGFDVACMQPNYAFTQNTAKVVYANAATTKRLGMCVEMEIGGLSHEQCARFRIYMKVGAQTGYMNALHMYYQGGGPGEFYHARLSDDEKVRNIYHELYTFVKHRLPLADIRLDTCAFETKADSVLDARIASGDDIIVATLYEGTKNGSLTLANDGSFKYIPKKDFKGLDRFYVDVTVDGKVKDIFEITVSVIA